MLSSDFNNESILISLIKINSHSLIQQWSGEECLKVFYESNGAVMLMDTIANDSTSNLCTGEAAAAALQAAVRKDPSSAFQANQNSKGFIRSTSGTWSVESHGGNTPAQSTVSSPNALGLGQGLGLQLKLPQVVDLVTCTCAAVQMHLVTIIGLIAPLLNSVTIQVLLDRGLIFLLCSLYTAPPMVQLKTAAIHTTNVLLRFTLQTLDLEKIAASIVKALLSADVCDIITARITSFSVGDESTASKEGLLETLTLLELLSSQPSAKLVVSPWGAKPSDGCAASPLENTKEYPVSAGDLLLVALASYARANDDLLNMCIIKIFDTAVHIALHCASRTLLLVGTSFASSCIEIACNSSADRVTYHAIIFLSCVAYLPAFAQPLIDSHRHINLSEKILSYVLPSSDRSSDFSGKLYIRSSADVLLYILYQTAVNSSLLTLSSIVDDDFLVWDAYTLYLTIARSDLLWSSLAKTLREVESEIPFVALRMIHVLASYKDLDVLETVWVQLQKFDIPQLLINLGASMVSCSLPSSSLLLAEDM